MAAINFRGKFNTHEQDRTGLQYFNARYYDPELGRFVQADDQIPDPGMTQSYNRYMFCAGNPVSFVDASGHSWLSGTLNKIGEIGSKIGDMVSDGASYVSKKAGELWESTKGARDAIGKGWDSAKGAVIGGLSGFAGGIAGGLILGSLLIACPFLIPVFLGPMLLTPGLGMLAGAALCYYSTATVLLPATIMMTCVIGGAITGGIVGAISGYEMQRDGKSMLKIASTNTLFGVWAGANPVYWSYAGKIAMLNIISGGQVNNNDSQSDYTYGQSLYNENYDKNMKARPWFPGDTHTTGRNGGDGWSYLGNDNCPLMVALDMCGLHGTSVIHDNGCDNGNRGAGIYSMSGLGNTADGMADSLVRDFFGKGL